jgi:hypothetical protein
VAAAIGAEIVRISAEECPGSGGFAGAGGSQDVSDGREEV